MENPKLQQHPYEQQEGEDENFEEGLVIRRKKLDQTPLEITINADFNSNNGGSIGVKNSQEQEQDEEEVKDFGQQIGITIDEVKDFGQQNGINFDEDEDEDEKEKEKEKKQRSDYCVYYDKDKDTGLHFESSGVDANGVDCVTHGKIPVQDNIDVKRPNEDNKNGLWSNSSIRPSEMSFEELDKSAVKDGADEVLEEGLVVRRKNLNQTPLSITINGDFNSNNGGSVGVNNGEEQEQEDEEEIKDFGQQNVVKIDEGEDKKEKDKQQKSDFCVYYDKDKDFGLHFESSVVDPNGKIPVQENIDIKRQNQDNRSNLSSNSLQPSEISFEEVEKSEDLEVIKDEATEFDVETVLKKQDTHDLYCPNCNSCITKRVILRKRKRRIRTPAEDAKRNKPETVIPSELNVVSDDSENGQALNGIDLGLNDAQPDEYDRQREPDVFRCLSCFSIFTPSGNGFKLFHMLRNKSDEQNNQHSQNEVRVKKGWFSFIFPWDKNKTEELLNNQGAGQSLDRGNNVTSNQDEPNDQASMTQEDNSLTTNDTTDLTNKPTSGSVPSLSLTESNDRVLETNEAISATPSVGGDDNATSSKQGYDNMIEQWVVNESDNAIQKSKGGAALDSPVADTNVNDQLLNSYHIESNGKSDYPGTFVVKPPFNSVDPEENAISPLQHDGLKLLIPPNVGSLVIDNSQMNQNLDVTVQMSNPASEVSQQRIVQNNVEIHLEEPLLVKVDEDVLIDKKIKLHDDLKNIERTTGNDTIITIESKQLDASGLQRSPDPIRLTGVPALQHVETGNQAVEGVGTTTATEGRSLDVIKSIVFGGLMESIASLSVVSSASGGNAATLNVLALGLANIFGGLFVICHDLWDLKNERTRGSSDASPYQEDRYQQLLGRKSDFPLHMAVSLSSYLVFGLLPPIVYGFSFRTSNDKDLKLLMVAGASVLCIMILAAGKAYVQRPRKSYLKTIAYYVVFGFMVSGVSFLFGELVMKLLEKLDIFDSASGSGVKLNMRGRSSRTGFATY